MPYSTISEQEAEEYVARAKEYAKEHLSTPEQALAFLVRAGIATPTGKLTKPYR